VARQPSCPSCLFVDFQAIIRVITLVECPTGFACPTASDFIQFVRIQSNHLIFAGPPSWEGSSEFPGVSVRFVFRNDFPEDPIQSFHYSVVQVPPPTPTGLILTQDPSEGCQGIMIRLEPRHCVLTNEYRVATTSSTP
jgi:hypothetical protein